MAHNSTDTMYHEWNLKDSDPNSASNNYLLRPHSLSRKLSDHNSHNSNNNSHQHHTHQHQQSIQLPPEITTTDYSDPSSLSGMRVPQTLFNRKKSLDAGYDTDGGIGTSKSISKPHPHSINGYEHFVSPRLSLKRSGTRSPKLLPVVSPQRHSSQNGHLNVNSSSGVVKNQDDEDDKPIYEVNEHRRHIRLSRQVHQRSLASKNHGEDASHSSTIAHHNRVLTSTSSGRPLKLIFMRHSERANQALGSDWFSKAFRTNTYKSYDQNLPMMLPKRHSDLAYEFDPPLTVRGLQNARYTGRAMLSTNLIADVCLSSTALRCIQTSERILRGMERTDRVPIRIEPGLFECPHLHHKIVDSFMTKKELVDNGYKIKTEYKPLIEKVNVPESLDEYFDRCVTVMRGILDRYGHHGGTILIITHAPGVLALTDALKGIRPHHDTFYRIVAAYPPLAMYIAEYDGTKWKNSDQPFSITHLGQ